MSRRFLIAPEGISGDTFQLSGPEAEHAIKVLRLRVGATLELMDGKGEVYEAVIGQIRHNREITGTLKALATNGGSAARIHLYAALIKADRWEWMIEKAAELGAVSITPVAAARGVVELKETARVEAKLERWRRILVSAAKQCQSDSVTDLEPPRDFTDALQAAPGLKLMAWEGLDPRKSDLRAALKDFGSGSPVSLFIGPEGGFTEEEISAARSVGIKFFSLGPQILRAETAALAAVALVGYEMRLNAGPSAPSAA